MLTMLDVFMLVVPVAASLIVLADYAGAGWLP